MKLDNGILQRDLKLAKFRGIIKERTLYISPLKKRSEVTSQSKIEPTGVGHRDASAFVNKTI